MTSTEVKVTPTQVVLIVDDSEESATVLAEFERLHIDHDVSVAHSRHGALRKPAVSYVLGGQPFLAEGEHAVIAWTQSVMGLAV